MANYATNSFKVSFPPDQTKNSCLLTTVTREFYAPNVDMDVFPASVVLPSTHNTTIESIWRLLREKTGLNLKDIVLRGKNEHIFYAHAQQHQ